MPHNYIWKIAIDAQDNKWIGTNWGGLAKFDGINWTVYDNSNSGLLYNSITAIAIDEQDNKWIGCYWPGTDLYGGLEVFNENGINIPIKTPNNTTSKSRYKITLLKNHQITRISYTIPKQSKVTLKVFDIKGRVLKTLVKKKKKTGDYQIDFDSHDLSNGAYFVHLRVGSKSVTKKMVVIQ